ncbi:MAG: monovalent cation/H+ antiporter complex subunit F [Bacteroidales bacterium]|jgi:multicomponent Na+:H+ antiporter subunit F
MINLLLTLALGFMLAAMVVAAIRFFMGPRTTDRVIAFDVLTITSLSLIVLIAWYAGRSIYLDIAIVYGLLSFLGVIIIARYLEKGL